MIVVNKALVCADGFSPRRMIILEEMKSLKSASRQPSILLWRLTMTVLLLGSVAYVAIGAYSLYKHDAKSLFYSRVDRSFRDEALIKYSSGYAEHPDSAIYGVLIGTINNQDADMTMPPFRACGSGVSCGSWVEMSREQVNHLRREVRESPISDSAKAGSLLDDSLVDDVRCLSVGKPRRVEDKLCVSLKSRTFIYIISGYSSFL